MAGADAAKEAITEGISRLTEQPNIVCAGFAGAARPDSAAFYKEILRSLLPGAQIIIESDAFIASIGALGIDPGILLIAGTGSIIIGRNKGSRHVPGWRLGPSFRRRR
jgi:glucosamine kinase